MSVFQTKKFKKLLSNLTKDKGEHNESIANNIHQLTQLKLEQDGETTKIKNTGKEFFIHEVLLETHKNILYIYQHSEALTEEEREEIRETFEKAKILSYLFIALKRMIFSLFYNNITKKDLFLLQLIYENQPITKNDLIKLGREKGLLTGNRNDSFDKIQRLEGFELIFERSKKKTVRGRPAKLLEVDDAILNEMCAGNYHYTPVFFRAMKLIVNAPVFFQDTKLLVNRYGLEEGISLKIPSGFVADVYTQPIYDGIFTFMNY